MADRINRILDFLSDQDLGCEIRFIIERNKRLESHKFAVTKKALPIIREEYKNFFQKRINKDELEMWMDDTSTNGIFFERADNIKDYQKFLIEPESKPINFDDLKKLPIRVYLIIMTDSKLNKLQIFRIPEKSRQLKKDSYLYIIESNSTLDIDTKSMFAIDYLADCCLFQNEFVVFSLSKFEILFSLFERYEQHSKEVFSFFKTNNRYKIKDIENFERQCVGNRDRLRKMSSIHNYGVYRLLNLEEIKKILNDLGILAPIDDTTKVIDIKFQDFIRFFNIDRVQNPYDSTSILDIQSKRINKKT